MMERKGRIFWIIILIVLLIAALVAAVLFKIKLDNKIGENDELKQSTTSLQQELDQTKTDVEALRAEYDALLAVTAEPTKPVTTDEPEPVVTDKPESVATDEPEPVVTDKPETVATDKPETVATDEPETVTTEEPKPDATTEAQGEVEQLKATLAQQEAELEKALSELTAAKEENTAIAAEKAALETEHTTLQETADRIQKELDASTTREAELAAALKDAEDGVFGKDEELNTAKADLDTANSELSTVKAELETVKADLANALNELEGTQAELESLRVKANAEDGTNHLSAEAADKVLVAADGVTSVYPFKNNATSGNALIFALEMNDTVIFTSASIAPGEELGEFVLTQPLAAGEYEAVAVIKTISAGGAEVSQMKLPIVISVAE